MADSRRPLSALPRLLVSVAIGLTLAYVILCILLYTGQQRFIFFPSARLTTTPADYNLKYEDVWIPVGQGDTLHGWWIPQLESGQVVLFLHGNGINVSVNAGRAAAFAKLGVSVLLIDYRGYGRSSGAFPSEKAVYEDAQAAWDFLVKQGFSPPQIVIYGHSLGGNIGIDLASRQPELGGLIAESTFTSVRDMAALDGAYWMFPLGILVHQRFDAASKVHRVRAPLLFIHGEDDSIVPPEMSKRLHDIATSRKHLLLVPGADHDDVAFTGAEAWTNAVRSFIAEARPAWMTTHP